MAKTLTFSTITMPDGTMVTKGPNGYLDPEVPCARCGRRIRYYKGPYDVFPWFCSRECARGDAFADRCAVCHGAMRKPILLGERDGQPVVTCKSCSLRINRLIGKMNGMDPDFLKWVLGTVQALLEKSLRMPRFDIQGRHLIHTKKVQPRKPRHPKKDLELQGLIERGLLNEDGTYKSGQYAGQHYREVNPR